MKIEFGDLITKSNIEELTKLGMDKYLLEKCLNSPDIGESECLAFRIKDYHIYIERFKDSDEYNINIFENKKQYLSDVGNFEQILNEIKQL